MSSPRPATGTPRPAWDTIRDRDIPTLVTYLFDPVRSTPVLVVSQAGDTRAPRVDPQCLVDAVGDVAEVKVLASPAAGWTFSSEAPGFDVYGGAIRLFSPAAGPRADPADHPLFETYPGGDSAETLTAIAHSLESRGFRRPRPIDLAPASARQAKRAEKLREVHRRLAEVTRDRDQLRDRATELEATITDLRRRLRAADTELATARARSEEAAAPLFTDPEAQLRHDIWMHWLRATAEGDRKSRPLRSYTLGADFVGSLSLEGVARERVLAVIVDVLTRAVFGHPGRHPHQQRVNPAPSAKALTRPDGATAWRCSVKDRTPSAPRLMWWELSNGGVELGRLAQHDDTRLR